MTKKILAGWLQQLSLILVFMATLGAPAANGGDSNALVAGNDAFALDLYSRLATADGNLFFSPYSISACLAMTYAGARGNTASQMAKTLHFGLDQSRLASAFGDLQHQLNALELEKSVQMNVANGLWAQQGYPFLPAFLDVATKTYDARLSQVNFLTQAQQARKEVNDWVSQQTKGKIVDLLSQEAVKTTTRLILVNAIYFKGQWTVQFNKARTADAPFSIAPGKTVQAPLMSLTETFNYAAPNGLQLLELPYAKGDLAMVILLPNETNGLPRLESSLNAQKLDEWLSQAKKQKVRVWVPRFKMTSSFGLANTLTQMGMRDAFSMDADFSGMDGTKMLYLSAVVHQAFVDVNEEGTEAAAATGAVMALKSEAPRPIPVFRADHPFIFLIRDTHSGSILFLGRVADPTS